MSSLPIPCIYTWTAPTITNKRDTVKITITHESRSRDYEIHAEALNAHSGRFRSALSSSNSNTKRPPINFALAAPTLFDVFVIWLYQGILDNVNETKFTYLFLVQLYVFADAFDIPTLRNKIVSVFFTKLFRDAPALPYDVVAYLEGHARDTALRAMLLDILLECGEAEEVELWKVNLAKGFWVKGSEKAEEGGMEPFGRKEDMWSFLAEMRGKVCEKYHEHSEGDGRATEYAEGTFFDPPM